MTGMSVNGFRAVFFTNWGTRAQYPPTVQFFIPLSLRVDASEQEAIAAG